MHHNKYFNILGIIILWLLATSAQKVLLKTMSKKVLLIFTAIVYMFLMLFYTYLNWHECKVHLPNLTFQTTALLLFIPIATFFVNILFLNII